MNFFSEWRGEGEVSKEKSCVEKKINSHLKGSECIRAEFAVVSCSVALEQCNCART